MRVVFVLFLLTFLILGTVDTAGKKKKNEKTTPAPISSEEDEDPIPEKTLDEVNEGHIGKYDKKPRKPDENGADDDERMLEACSGLDDQLCVCDVDTIDCRNVDFGQDNYALETANLKIMKKDFKPLIADFSDNRIGTKLHVDEILPGSEKYVSELKFSINAIITIDPNAFVKFTNLSKLYLDHNSIKNLKPEWFAPLNKTLHKLDLSNNQFTDIPDGMFASLKNLRVLNLDNNPLKLRKEMFRGLDNLEELSLDGCRITDLPGDIFEYMPNLKGVSIAYNKFTELPRALSNIKNLESLDISGTAIAEIHDNAFGTLKNLEEIYMEKMTFLTVIRDCAFCGLVNLKKVISDNNTKLVEFHPNAFGFIESEPGMKVTQLEELDIRDCNISAMSQHTLDFSALKIFKYGGNPWNCTCDLQFMIGEDQVGGDYDHVFAKCAYPKELKGKTLYSLKQYQVCEETRQAHKTSRILIIFVLFLLVIFVSLGCFLLVSTGKLSDMLRKVQVPEVSYSNLTDRCEENIILEDDFQARPAQV